MVAGYHNRYPLGVLHLAQHEPTPAAAHEDCHRCSRVVGWSDVIHQEDWRKIGFIVLAVYLIVGWAKCDSSEQSDGEYEAPYER